MYKMNNEEKLIEIGLNIAYYRKKKGLRQRDLADKVYISQEQLSRIESPRSNASTTISTLLAISDALEIDVRQLFDFTRGE